MEVLEEQLEIPPPPEGTAGFVESLENREELSRTALASVSASFIYARGQDIAENSRYTTAELRGMSLASFGLESLDANHKLLEDVGSEKEADRHEPACTICIPAAILGESEETITHTLSLIKNAQMSSGKLMEVILWTNANYVKEEDEQSTNESARQKYESLREKLKDLSGEGLRVRTALQVLPKERAAISQLRSNFMDAVAMEALERGYSYEHPVIWLDADTTFLAKNSLGDIETAVRRFDALFVHANTQYSTEWAKGKKLHELDDATKVVVVNEIHRRQIVRGRDDRDSMSAYIEESGLAFALGTYLKAGGVDTSDKLNESAFLVNRVINQEQDARWNYEYRLEGSSNYDSQQDEITTVPKFLLSADQLEAMTGSSEKNGKHLITVLTLKSARIGTSARRHHEVVKRKGADGLYGLDADGYGDELFIDMGANGDPDDQREVSVTGDDLKAHVAKTSADEPHKRAWRDFEDANEMRHPGGKSIADLREEYEQRKGSYDRVIDRLITKHFNDTK